MMHFNNNVLLFKVILHIVNLEKEKFFILLFTVTIIIMAVSLVLFFFRVIETLSCAVLCSYKTVKLIFLFVYV